VDFDIAYSIEISLHDLLDRFPEAEWRKYGQEYALPDGSDWLSIEFKKTNPGNPPPRPPEDPEKKAARIRRAEKLLDEHYQNLLDLSSSDPKRTEDGM